MCGGTDRSASGAAWKRLRVSGLTYGPHGIGRLNGKVVFVRGVVPGEQVDVRVREDHGSFAYADLCQVATAAPDRRLPPCPYLPRCGGCPWQHLTYPAQLRAKVQNLRDHLERIAGAPDVAVRPIIASPRVFAYRSRLTLRIADRRVGFYAGGTHDLVPITHCLLAAEGVDRAIQVAADLVRQLHSDIRRIEAVQATSPRNVVLRGEVHGKLSTPDAEFLLRWLAQRDDVGGVVLEGRGWRHAWGDEHISLRPEEDLILTVRCGAFTQVNPEANRLLVRTVLALGEFGANDRVLDLYAGVGNLSFPIARRVGRLVAVEQQPEAAEDARTNAAALGFSNCEVRTASACKALRELRRQSLRFDTAVLDPPRGGAADIVRPLLDLAPARLVYVSCNPATLARDLKRLSSRYRVDVVQPIDLFPQSYHVEAVARLVLTAPNDSTSRR